MENITSIYVPDTNVLIYDPESIDVLREGGNLLVIPMAVIFELDKLKNKPETGYDARDSIKRLEEILDRRDDSLKIHSHPASKYLKGLDRNNPDHQIIATAKTVDFNKKSYGDYKEVKLISKDATVRLIGKKLNLQTEDYRRNKIENPRYKTPTKINVDLKWGEVKRIKNGKNGGEIYSFPYDLEKHGEILENEGVVCFSNEDERGWKESFAALRKGNRFKSLPNDIRAFGLVPYSINGNGKNWNQYIALGQLLDPEIQLVFLQGGAGTGKTLLAVASAFQQRSKFRNIIITRPLISADEGRDNLGYMPGDMDKKLAHWMVPIEQAIEFLKEIKDQHGRESNRNEIERIIDKNKVKFVSLDHIRGVSYHRTFLIVDEAQNLTPHQVKTIITRAGEDTKVVFTGDLGQIDLTKRIDRKSSGLTYAMNKMIGHPLVAATNFVETVRSELASLADERL